VSGYNHPLPTQRMPSLFPHHMSEITGRRQSSGPSGGSSARSLVAAAAIRVCMVNDNPEISKGPQTIMAADDARSAGQRRYSATLAQPVA
jgi:hypothetical protein